MQMYWLAMLYSCPVLLYLLLCVPLFIPPHPLSLHAHVFISLHSSTTTPTPLEYHKSSSSSFSSHFISFKAQLSLLKALLGIPYWPSMSKWRLLVFAYQVCVCSCLWASPITCTLFCIEKVLNQITLIENTLSPSTSYPLQALFLNQWININPK